MWPRSKDTGVVLSDGRRFRDSSKVSPDPGVQGLMRAKCTQTKFQSHISALASGLGVCGRIIECLTDCVHRDVRHCLSSMGQGTSIESSWAIFGLVGASFQIENGDGNGDSFLDVG